MFMVTLVQPYKCAIQMEFTIVDGNRIVFIFIFNNCYYCLLIMIEIVEHFLVLNTNTQNKNNNELNKF